MTSSMANVKGGAAWVAPRRQALDQRRQAGADQQRHHEGSTLDGAMPAKVSLNIPPSAAAGLANDVDAANQHAAPM